MSANLNEKVSVIIPFYRNTEWLDAAINSVLNQTYDNFEIILVNDGSQENINQILEKHGSYIKYLYQKNKGAGSARNLGLSFASGDYIAFLDSDDIWLPNKLENQISFMKKTNAAWSHTGYFYWNPSNGRTKTVNVRNEYGNIYKKAFVSIKMATPCVVLRKSILDENPHLCFNEKYRIGQDTKFWQEISKLYPIALLREPLTKVRLRDDNTHKQYLKLMYLRANEFQLIKDNPDVPLVAKAKSLMYLSASKILPQSSSSKFTNNIAKISMVPPYLLGRFYVNLLSLTNVKHYKLVK